ncbi:hypothetical protein D5H75_16875 [Bailinhaonella thermotolerans]|uniref:Uncharacterized protein n=1 Tax=Bailinhaonella thermotolerans TaxID=1070861 RepID=A0A3A4AUZ3_9ACTN|nr:hypothetical protein D5H75_16875 [Bailinhaonella thermotolerans]
MVPDPAPVPDRRRSAVARRGGGPAPIHEAGRLELAPGPLRHDHLKTIGERAKTRLEAHAGRIVDWYAAKAPDDPYGRAYAVVFGERALCFARPRVREGRRVYAVSAYVLDPDSHKRVEIVHAPGAAAAPAGAWVPGGGHRILGLRTDAYEVLGTLPPRAQELLQAPFLAGQSVHDCDWYYEGYRDYLEMFMIYLAGRQDVTVLCGSRKIPPGHSEADAHWRAVCHRAKVAQRIGT